MVGRGFRDYQCGTGHSWRNSVPIIRDSSRPPQPPFAEPLCAIFRAFRPITTVAHRVQQRKERFMVKKILLLAVVCLSVSSFVGCENSQVASRNISRAAHQFEIFRRVVFYNGITGEYILQIEGYCSVTQDSMGKVSVVIKTADGSFLKHYLGLSDNVTYFAEQLHSSKVSTARYRVIFKPSVIIPSIDLE